MKKLIIKIKNWIMAKFPKNARSTRLEQRINTSEIIIDAMEAGKKIIEHRDRIDGVVEMNIGGLKLQMASKEAVNACIDAHIKEARKYGLNENSDYGEKDQ